ncbi:MAG: immunoglobulin domain-containing protein [Labilibaculum antarcticum]
MRRIFFKLVAVASLLLSFTTANAQFTGGDGDGYAKSLINVSFSTDLDDSQQFTLCMGSDVAMEVVVESGNYPVSYQWYHVNSEGNVVQLNLQTNSSLAVADVTAEVSGGYYCEVNVFGVSKSSKTVTYNVLQLPDLTLTDDLNGGVLCAGDIVRMEATSAGVWDSYEWYFNEDTTSLSSTYNCEATPQSTGDYIVKATKSGCSAKDTLTINVLVPNVNLGHDLYIVSGDEVSLDAGDSADWTSDDTEFAEITGQSVITVSPTGNTNYVAASAACSDSYSDSINVFVHECSYTGGEGDGYARSPIPISIIEQPESILTCEGQMDFLEVLARGSFVEYFWKKYNELSLEYELVASAPNITGENRAKIIFNSLLPENEGKYICVIRNDFESKETEIATVGIVRLPVILSQLDDQQHCENNEEVVSLNFVVENPHEIIGYVWYKDGALLPDGGNENYLNFEDLKSSDAGTYKCVVENSCGKVSTEAVLEVLTAPIDVELEYDNLDLCEGVSTILKVMKSAETYQWMNVVGTDFSHIPILGATKATLQLVDVDIWDSGKYICELTNSCGSSFSGVSTVNVLLQPQLNDIEINGVSRGIDGDPLVVCEASSLEMSLILARNDNYTFTWRRNGLAVEGMNTPTLSIISMGSEQAGFYTCVVDNGVCDPEEYQVAMVSVSPIPVIKSINQNVTICEESAFKFEVIADFADEYKWYLGELEVGSSSVYEIDTVRSEQAGTYKCEVNNSCGSAPVKYIDLEVNTKPRFTKGLIDKDFCFQMGAQLNVEVSGTEPIKFFWKKDDIDLNCAESSLSLGLVTEAKAGLYSCHVSNFCEDADSEAEIGVLLPPVQRSLQGGGSICNPGNSEEIYLDNTSVDDNYILYRTGIVAPVTALLNGEGAQLSFGYFDIEGQYYAKAVNNFGCIANMNGEVEILNAQPQDLQAIVSKGFCEGTTGATISLMNPELNTTYRLYKVEISGDILKGEFSASDELKWEDLEEGIYYLLAENLYCTKEIGNRITVQIQSLPYKFTLYTLNSDYCSSGLGAELRLDGSESGVSYQLTNGIGEVSELTGTGSELFWTDRKAEVYHVLGTNESGCSVQQKGTVTVVRKEVPAIFNLEGGLMYCGTSLPQAFSLSGSQNGIQYYLENEAGRIDASENIVTDITGAGFTFPGTYLDGVYKAVALNTMDGCKSVMNGESEIGPFDLTVTGDRIKYIQPGNEAFFNIEVSGGNGNYSYSWLPQDLIQDASETTQDARTETLLTSCELKLEITDDQSGCVAPAKLFQVAVQSAVSFSVVPVSWATNNLCPNSTVTYSVNATGGSGIYYYTWTYNGQTYETEDNFLELNVKNGGRLIVRIDDGFHSLNPIELSATLGLVSMPDIYNFHGDNSCEGTETALVLNGFTPEVDYYLWEAGRYSRRLNSTNIPVPPEMSDGNTIQFGSYSTAGEYRVDAAVQDYKNKICYIPMNNVVYIDPMPTKFAMWGTNIYCENSELKIHLGLDGLQPDIIYELYKDSEVQTNSFQIVDGEIDFDEISQSGTYTITGTSPNSNCVSEMKGVADITINPNPDDITVNYTGSLCEGEGDVVINITNGQYGVSYALYDSQGIVPGQAAILWDASTESIIFDAVQDAGNYYVLASNASMCRRKIEAVTIESQLQLIEVKFENTYCSGGGAKIWLSGSEENVTYYVDEILDGNPTDTRSVNGQGSGADIFFPGTYQEGDYRVRAVSSSGCTRIFNQTITIQEVQIPNSELNILTIGDSCEGGAGLNIKLDNSENGVSYQLLFGDEFVSGVEIIGIDGQSIDFGTHTDVGNYHIYAENIAGCNTEFGDVEISKLPDQKSLAGNNYYCSSYEVGALLNVLDSEIEVDYQLYQEDVNGDYVAFGNLSHGNGGMINFTNVVEGNYKLHAKSSNSSCGWLSNDVVSVKAESVAGKAVAEYGDGCIDINSGVIKLSGIDANHDYTLEYYGIVSNVGFEIVSASELQWTSLATGNYSFKVTDQSTGCYVREHNIELKQIPQKPIISANSECCENLEIPISITNTKNGVSYILNDGTFDIDTILSQVSGSLQCRELVSAGMYTVRAEKSACVSELSDVQIVSSKPTPTEQNVTGANDNKTNGITIGLDGAEIGIIYKLYRDGNFITQVEAINTNSFNFFNTYYEIGVYSIVAVDGSGTLCSAEMAGSVEVCEFYNLSVIDYYCEGDASGVSLQLYQSQAGVTYKLFKDGTEVSGSDIIGDGRPVIWNDNTNGSYEVKAVKASDEVVVGSCSIAAQTVPDEFSIVGGDFICPGMGVGLNIPLPQVGINYALYSDAVFVEYASDGNSDGIMEFTDLTKAGSYTIKAIDINTSCFRSVSKEIAQKTLPKIFSVTGGAICKTLADDKVVVGLDGSEAELTYTLFRYNTFVTSRGGSIDISNPAISFGEYLQTGYYTVKASYSEGECASGMYSYAELSEPQNVYNLIGVNGNSQTICEGDEVEIKLANSDPNTSYQLERTIGVDSVQEIGSPVNSGGGGEISLGKQSEEGIYTVHVSSACATQMTGQVEIFVNPVPDADIELVERVRHICPSTDTELKLSTSQSGITYSLYKGNPDIPGDIAIRTIPGDSGNGEISFGRVADDGVYYVVAFDDAFPTNCSVSLTSQFEVLVDPQPLLQEVKVENDGSLCINNDAGLNIYLTNSEDNVSYQLTSPTGEVISTVDGATGNQVSFGKYTFKGIYGVKAIGKLPTACSTELTGVSIIEAALPEIYDLSALGAPYYCEGQAGSSIELANSQAGVEYQLLKDDMDLGLPQSGSGSLQWNSLMGKNFNDRLNEDDGVEYKVYATNATNNCAVFMRGAVMISEDVDVTINSHPSTPLKRCTNADAFLTVVADGGHLGYQWYKGSVGVLSATKSNLNFEPFQLADEGIYYCNVSNVCNSVNSNNSLIEIKEPAIITKIESPTNVCLGVETVLQVSSLGATDFQWYKDGLPLDEENMNFLFIDTVSLAHDADYYCEATNGCPPDQSATVHLSVDSIPVISFPSETVYLNLCPNQSKVLEVEATGGGLTYKWSKNGEEIAGETESSIRVSNFITDSQGTNTYVAKLSNSCNDLMVESPAFVISFLKNPVVIDDIENVTKCETDSHEFEVFATGGNLTYQWYRDHTEIVGETSSKITFASLLKIDEDNYYCSVANECSNTASASVRLQVNEVKGLETNDIRGAICSGDGVPVRFWVDVETEFIGDFKWRIDGNEIVGEISPLLEIANPNTNDNGHYTCTVDSKCIRDVSEISYLKVDTIPGVLGYPLDNKVEVCVGEPTQIELSVKAGELDYRWQKEQGDGSFVDLVADDQINSVGTAVHVNSSVYLKFEYTTEADDGNYRCVMSNPCDADVISEVLRLDVVEVPVPGVQWPDKIVVHNNFVVVLSASVSTEAYYWIENDQGDVLTSEYDGANQSAGKLTLVGLIDNESIAKTNLIVKSRGGNSLSCISKLVSKDNIEVTMFHGLYAKVQMILGGAFNGAPMNEYGILDNLPLTSPFGEDDQDGDGIAETLEEISIPAGQSKSTVLSGVVDWIKLSLRANRSDANLAEISCVLKTDGNLYMTSDLSNAGVVLPDLGEPDYFIVVESRNHLDFVTQNKIGLSIFELMATTIDFRSESVIYDQCAKISLGGGMYALVPGDITSDGLITVDDFSYWFNDLNLVSTGYLFTDINLDGRTTVDDYSIWFNKMKEAIVNQGF